MMTRYSSLKTLTIAASLLLTIAALERQVAQAAHTDSFVASSTECPTTDGDSCSSDGSSNYVDRTGLTYDASTGKFSGTLTTNLCNEDSISRSQATAICETQTFPAATGPEAASIRGRVGMTLRGGTNIYGPLEDGFSEGMACDGGSCDSGLDLETCEAQLEYSCDEGTIKGDILNDCNGHANPYHHHKDLQCAYDSTGESDHDNENGHSPALALGLDGVVLYGLYESGGDTKPTDLDACGGHVGPVHDDATYGISAGTVYHYHTQSVRPWTIGCFGPVASEDECKSLYDTCNTGYLEVTTNSGTETMDDDCPCWDNSSTSSDSTTDTEESADTEETTPTPTTEESTDTEETTPTPTEETTPTPTSSDTSMQCDGLLSDDGSICCLSTCSSCGDPLAPGGSCDTSDRTNCCKGRIRNSGAVCDTNPAPCMMGESKGVPNSRGDDDDDDDDDNDNGHSQASETSTANHGNIFDEPKPDAELSAAATTVVSGVVGVAVLVAALVL